MSCDYDKIRNENILEYGQGTRHLSFLGRLYSDRTHFLFELLQNAEDADASQILFHLFEDRLEVKHNGRLFDEKDVRGVCGVGAGTKAEDLTQIGKFGIGFKSVYAYTSTPEIHCGDESFCIKSYVRPYQIDKKQIDDPWTTLFIFPFNNTGIDQDTACDEIAKRLVDLRARTLLFLRKINEVVYLLPDSSTGFYKRETTEKGSARQVVVKGENGDLSESERWLVFHRPVLVPESTEKVYVEIAFHMDLKKDKTQSIIKLRNAPLVVYFPTDKTTGFGFLAQGPYRTTPSRDNTPKDVDWNIKLVNETAILVAEALRSLKKMKLLTISVLETMPINMDYFPEDSMFRPIATKVQEVLTKEKLLPTAEGAYVSGNNAKIARGSDLRSLLKKKQLRSLYNSSKAIKWLSGEITQDRTPDLRAYLIDQLEIDELTPEGFARLLTVEFLEQQNDEWVTEFYGFLIGQEALWRAPRFRGYVGGPLRSKSIIRLHDGTHQMPFDEEGIPSVFLPPASETDFPVVKRDIANDENARDFLKRLGLSEPDIFDEIVEKVLPKYDQLEQSQPSEQEHYSDLKKILDALCSDSEEGKKKILSAAEKRPFLRAKNSDGNITFKEPKEIYLKTEELKKYFSATSDVWFIDEPEQLVSDYQKTIQLLGVARLPRKIKFYGELPANLRERSTEPETINNFQLHGLRNYLSVLNAIDDMEYFEKESILLWRILEELLESDSDLFRGYYSWYYYKKRSKRFDNSIIRTLREEPWIYTRKGIKKPFEIDYDDLFEEFQQSLDLMDALGIGQTSRDNEKTEQQKKVELASELGTSIEDIDFITKHFAEFEKFKAEILTRDSRPEFPKKRVLNPERRKEKLLEQLESAPQKKYEKKERSNRTSREQIDPDPLLEVYYTFDDGKMYCQICKKEMPFKKRDEKYYFESVEVLTKEYIKKEHDSGFIALCPLCAAMYKEFIKKDSEKMTQLAQTVKSSEKLEIPLSLGELETTLQFVESHLFDLRIILSMSM